MNRPLVPLLSPEIKTQTLRKQSAAGQWELVDGNWPVSQQYLNASNVIPREAELYKGCFTAQAYF